MRTLNIAVILSCAILFGGCSAKILNPVGESEFGCSIQGEGGVCASFEDVYHNRSDVDALKRSKELPAIDIYIEEKCTIYQLTEEQERYDNCVKDARKAYKLQSKSSTDISVATKNAQTFETAGSLRNIVKAKEGIPLRQPESVTRIWIAPYQNDMGDLVYSHFIYVVQKRPHWLFVPEEDALMIKENSNRLFGE
ncbi:MAG: type IV conjugative transfer system lipoprotein TraV [Geovibrio sp.]|nr:type IV conjugative transfer system lipoprotein TraV [Geovibrio sp.]MCD8569385.1 type IV conjugative transfer system lipoprotein TraV [Geovibrio sp.]